MDAAEQTSIIENMWRHFGRIFAEYPHLETLSRDHTKIIERERLDIYLASGKPIIFISGHIGNWEVMCAALYMQLGQSIGLTYRPPNNPWIEKRLKTLRTMNGKIEAFPKSSAGGRYMMQTLKKGGKIGMLVDQKYNEGIIAEFFGAPAMTNPVFAQLALKYGALIVPVRCERICERSEFTLSIHQAIPTHDDQGEKRSIEAIVQDSQDLLQRWITARPEQWLWLHRRWRQKGERIGKRMRNQENHV